MSEATALLKAMALKRLNDKDVEALCCFIERLLPTLGEVRYSRFDRNVDLVLKAMEGGPLTRRDISKITQRSIPWVNQYVKRLIRLNKIKEAGLVYEATDKTTHLRISYGLV